MSIIWKSQAAESFLDLSNVFFGAVTGSDGSHVTIATSVFEIRLDGTFTGAPASDGTVTGFQLLRNGMLVLEAEGHAVSLKALLAAMGDPYASRPENLFLNDGDMVVKGSGLGEELVGGAFDDKLAGRGGGDYLSAQDGADLLKGGGGNDRMFGWDGNDKLKGGGGDDFLSGDLGRDLLIGGGGDDTFAFGPDFLKGDVDRIKKFKPGHDSITLYSDAFTSLEPLSRDQFHRGDHAQDSEDLVIYDAKSGSLFIDLDGAGGDKQIKFAKVDPGLKLSHHDFDLSPLG